MKPPSFAQAAFGVLFVGLFALCGACSATERERYIDYCGWSVYKRPGAIQEEGITPLLLHDKDVTKYEGQVEWIRPATSDELEILLRRYERRALPRGYQLWTVTADAPTMARTLARQYQCTIEGMLDTSQ